MGPGVGQAQSASCIDAVVADDRMGLEGVDHQRNAMFAEQIPLTDKFLRMVIVYALIAVLFRLTGAPQPGDRSARL
jgi:hypothetical protein